MTDEDVPGGAGIDEDTGATKVVKLDWPVLAGLAAAIGALVFWRRRKRRAEAAE